MVCFVERRKGGGVSSLLSHFITNSTVIILSASGGDNPDNIYILRFKPSPEAAGQISPLPIQKWSTISTFFCVFAPSLFCDTSSPSDSSFSIPPQGICSVHSIKKHCYSSSFLQNSNTISQNRALSVFIARGALKRGGINVPLPVFLRFRRTAFTVLDFPSLVFVLSPSPCVHWKKKGQTFALVSAPKANSRWRLKLRPS